MVEKQSFLTMKIDNDSLLLLNDAGSLSDEELNHKSNLTLPFRNYPKFDLDSLKNVECVSEFRFEKKDIYILGQTLQIPETVICVNRAKAGGIKSLCIYLKRFAYLCRHSDMISQFRRLVLEL